jgi:hypothetical protein
MKRVVRISILMLGLVGAYASAAVPKAPTQDGKPVGPGYPLQQTLPGK